MNTRTFDPTDDDLRAALMREPSTGLADVVADAVAREVGRTAQRGPRRIAWPWLSDLPGLGLRPAMRRTVMVAAVIALLLALLVSLVLVGSLLRRSGPLANGAVAIAPPEGGLVILGGKGIGTRTWAGDAVSFVTWSGDGQRLAYWTGSGHDWHFEVLDPQAGTITRPIVGGLPRTLEPNGPFAWSPDGRRVVADVLADGEPSVLILDLEAGTATRLGPPELDATLPALSSDGTRLVYLAQQRYANDWHAVIADGSGDDPRALEFAFPVGIGLAAEPMAWSPDGGRLLVTGGAADGSSRLFVDRLSDGSLTALDTSGIDPHLAAWSPDGTSIAFLTFDPALGANAVYVMRAGGADLRQVATGACSHLEWSPDGERLLFDVGLCDPTATTTEVRTVRNDGTNLETLWSEPRTAGDAMRAYGDTVPSGWQGLRP